MESLKPRVRFAPSPTGPLHMGGVRTALYNYLFAKNLGGAFILRVEDTDQTRYVAGAEAYIQEALAWCGLEPDEGPSNGGDFGPYRQSERKHLYRQYADQLLGSGWAYIAFDTPESLTEKRKANEAAKLPNWKYDAETRKEMRNSLTLSAEEVKQLIDAGEPHVIRFKTPEDEEVAFADAIRGTVRFHTSTMDDKVIFKSDGMPTYHLANVVDDKLMEITHVIRGEEWLSSAPLHVLLYRGLGWEANMPVFAHLPLILKHEGKGKLSKRDGAKAGFPVFPLEWKDPETSEQWSGYREEGYYADGFINMLALLGWSSGTEQEIYTRGELIAAFSLERVGKSGARFDPAKTRWFNQQYLWLQTNEELAAQLAPMLDEAGISYQADSLPTICNMMKERVFFVREIMENGRYLFEAPTSYNEKMVNKKWKPESAIILGELSAIFENIADFTPENLETAFKGYLEEKELGFGAAAVPLRLTLSGEGGGPGLFDIAAIIGKAETLERIKNGVTRLSELTATS